MMLVVFLAALFGFILLSVPIAFSLLLTAFVLMMAMGTVSLPMLAQNMVRGIDSFPLMAIPFFLFAGELMNVGGISRRIVSFARALIGHVTGGLGFVTVMASMLFAGVSGSAVADTSAIGSILYPVMKREGYDEKRSAALFAAAGTIGPIIPPSIPMVIYAMLTGTSVGYLFLGGILPGVVLAGCLMLWTAIIATKRKYPVGRWYPIREFVKIFLDSFLALLAPVILLGGIYTGVFTPTEAAGIVCVYGLLLSLLVYRTMGLKQLYKILVESVVAAGFTSFTIGGAFLFGYVLAREQIPAKVAEAFIGLGITSTPTLTMLSINVLFLILGCFVDVSASLLIVVPIVMPLIKAAGIDFVHFGVVVVLNLMIGLSTPPYGEAAFIISRVTNTPLGAVFRDLIRYILFMILALFLIGVFPDIVLWVPRLAGYKG